MLIVLVYGEYTLLVLSMLVVLQIVQMACTRAIKTKAAIRPKTIYKRISESSKNDKLELLPVFSMVFAKNLKVKQN